MLNELKRQFDEVVQTREINFSYLITNSKKTKNQ